MTSGPVPIVRPRPVWSATTHGMPAARRRAKVRRHRLAVALIALVLATVGWQWVSEARTEATVAVAAPSTVAGDDVVDPHAPTSTDDLRGLSPAMRRSLTAAIAAASSDGVHIIVASAHRSYAAQEALYEQAIATYGSPAAARRWVLPPSESMHVKGGAVDVRPRSAAAWLERNGIRFGLCRRYVNEWWHFERLARTPGSRCPALEPDASGSHVGEHG